MWGRDVATGPVALPSLPRVLARQTVEAQLRLRLPFSLGFVVVFSSWFLGFILRSQAACKNEVEGCYLPPSLSIHTASHVCLFD